MNEYPFILYLDVTLTSNGTGTMSYSVPPAQDLYLQELVFSSTGAFSVTSLRNSNGRVHSNASTSKPIPSTTLAQGNANTQGLKEFAPDLLIRGSEQIIIDILDTSGSGNTVKFALSCRQVINVS